MRHSGKESSIGMCHKTIADVDDDFGDRTPACREYTHPRADSVPQFHDELLLDQFLQVHIKQFLGTHGIEIQIPSTTTPNRSSWVVI